jgi:hypothetical protein
MPNARLGHSNFAATLFDSRMESYGLPPSLLHRLTNAADWPERRRIDGGIVALAKNRRFLRGSAVTSRFPNSLIFLYPIFGRSKLLTSKSRERDNAVARLCGPSGSPFIIVAASAAAHDIVAPNR